MSIIFEPSSRVDISNEGHVSIGICHTQNVRMTDGYLHLIQLCPETPVLPDSRESEERDFSKLKSENELMKKAIVGFLGKNSGKFPGEE